MPTILFRRYRNLVWLCVLFSALWIFYLLTTKHRTPNTDESFVRSEKLKRKRNQIISQYLLKLGNFSTKNKNVKMKDSRKHRPDTATGVPNVPKLVWWAPVSGMKDHGIKCDDVRCDISVKRSSKNDPNVRAFLFYGTRFEVTELPLPRLPHHVWALEHDESPKNNDFLFSHESIMTLFNFTSTFKRESSYPVPTMHLPDVEWLQSTKYVLSPEQKNALQKEKGLAPIIFVHSDCNVPSDRGTYLKMLQQYIDVDVYGNCDANKQLPHNLQGMNKFQESEFFTFVSQYKFAFAFENAVCDDYMTEKLWRPLHLGVIPLVFGSPKVKEFLPNEKSALVVEDFPSVKDLAETVKSLDKNNNLYQEYLAFKTEGGVTNKNLRKELDKRDWSLYRSVRSKKYPSYFRGYECFLCKRVHENMEREKNKERPVISVARKEDYGCPKPKRFNDQGKYVLDSSYDRVYTYSSNKAKAFRYFYDTKNMTFTENDISILRVKIEKFNG